MKNKGIAKQAKHVVILHRGDTWLPSTKEEENVSSTEPQEKKKSSWEEEPGKSSLYPTQQTETILAQLEEKVKKKQ